jgi:hypothetical protein
MEHGTKQLLLNISTNNTSLQFLFNPLNIKLHENVEAKPKVGYLWLLVAIVSPHHQVRYFFIGINVIFPIGDKVTKVEHAKVEFKVLVWRLGKTNDGKWLCNFKHKENMHYETFQLSIGAYTTINDDPN